MTVYRFEDLRVWQAAKQQYELVAALLDRPAFQRDRPLSEQMNKAALSVMLNISEGFLRRRDGETLQFLRYAFASNGELKAAYYAAESGRSFEPTEVAEFDRAKREHCEDASAVDGHFGSFRSKTRPRTKDQAPRTDQGPGTDQELRPKHQGPITSSSKYPR